ncbi:MAG TPA: hypothetical protein VEX35_05415 [Allosphingosinicella sp.]|nr:hypothetical protein [Allosphingosinicella sp.]
MLEAIDVFFSHFVQDQAKAAADKFNGTPNHDIYEKRLTEPDPQKWKTYRETPYSMYFYYVRINADGRLVVDHYFYVTGHPDVPATWSKIPYNKTGLTTLVGTLARNARPIREEVPRVRDPVRLRKGNFNKGKWIHKSYIAIFFDEANWSLRKKPTDGSESAIAFIVKEGNKVGLPNYTFFDAMDLEVEMPISYTRPDGSTTDKRSAIVFVNHMKRDEEGNDLIKGDIQDFVFKMILNVNAEATDDPPTVVIIDPGGSNEGPPIPPPPE